MGSQLVLRKLGSDVHALERLSLCDGQSLLRVSSIEKSHMNTSKSKKPCPKHTHHNMKACDGHISRVALNILKKVLLFFCSLGIWRERNSMAFFFTSQHQISIWDIPLTG